MFSLRTNDPWLRYTLMAGVFFFVSWLGQEADMATLRLLTLALGVALVALLALHFHAADESRAKERPRWPGPTPRA